MRKNLFFILSLLSIFTFLVSIAAAPATVRLLKLVSVEHWFNKGVVFKFEVIGDFTDQELDGFVAISSREFGLDCSFDDFGYLTCVGGDALDQFVYRNAVVVVAGQGFYTIIPPRLLFNATVNATNNKYCYQVYDSNEVDWFVTGDYCQDAPANNGDTITFPSGSQSEYIFDDGIGNCGNVNFGGYIYNVWCSN